MKRNTCKAVLATVVMAGSLMAAPPTTAAGEASAQDGVRCYRFRSWDHEQQRGPITMPFHPTGQEFRVIGNVGFDVCVRRTGEGKVWIKPRTIEGETVVTNLEDASCRWIRGWRFNFRIRDDRDHVIRQRIWIDCDGSYHTARKQRSVKGRQRLHWSKGQTPWWNAKVVMDTRFNPDAVSHIGGKLAVGDLFKKA